ncbi:MAG TPA: VWA domain-containing protein [Acidobacteriaceae bacterium]|nr:VWA domain-containing protein [Acidobacteriaceae bacterium]
MVLAPPLSLAFASKPISVQQLEEEITSAHTSNQTDDELTRQLTNVKLSERLTGDALQKLIALSPGPKTTQALDAIAGQSAFLDPPSSELPSTPAPDLATQKAIMSRTVNYVLHTLPTLPNFLAVRTTRQYSDSLRGIALVQERRGDLYWIGDHHATIAFRDGRESDDPTVIASLSSKKDVGANSKVAGMTSWGEFGPVLGLVLLDAARSKLAWQRWEMQNGKPVAVFQFSVPQTVSHYQLNYCCEGRADRVFNDLSDDDQKNLAIKPGYHGSLEVDPENGNVLRITIEADLQHQHTDNSISRASTMVEYGPMKIGDDTRFCPIRSVSLSRSFAQFESHGVITQTDRLLLNDVEFTNYHRFGSESTLLIGSADDKPENPGATPLEADSAPAAAAPDADTAETAKATPEAAPAPASPPPTPEPEISIHPATSLPGMDANPDSSTKAANSSEASFTLKATTRLVDLSLVATDKHGKPLTDLKQDEIEVYDNGRKQHIAAFHHPTFAEAPPSSTVVATPAAPPTEPGVFTNAVLTQANPNASGAAPDLLILLIDESHLALTDLNQAHGEMLRFLKATRPNARVALYSIGDYGFRVIQDVTQDHALMVAKLTAWVPSASAVALSRKQDERERQQAANLQDAQNLHGLNVQTYGDIQAAVPLGDPDLRTIGNNPLRLALEGMAALARHFATVPGHKSLAWISGDRALADLSSRLLDGDAKKRFSWQLESAIAHTREALNDAHISLYVVDASMPTLAGGGLDASRYTPGAETSPAATSNQVPGGAPKAPLGDGSGAQMQLDLAGIQGPLRALAKSTGGRAIDRGDLVKALDGIESDSRALYEVSFGPDTPPDGQFHTLELKIPNRKDAKLRYRTGYEYSEETGNTQQRFQQAIWSPQDASGIRLTAEAVSASDTASGNAGIKLSIAFPGLALEQKDSRWRDNLYIFVAQRDDAAQKAEVSGDTLRLSLQQATYNSGMPAGIPYHRDVEIKSKLGSVRIIVVDGNSGKMGSVTLPSSALSP